MIAWVKHRRLVTAMLVFCPILVVLGSLFIGRLPITIESVLRILTQQSAGSEQFNQAQLESIILQIRLPRALLGCLVGGALAVSGTAFQGLFRNPLVNSGMLGVSSGAGFGAALSIILFNGQTGYTYLFAFAFGGLAVYLSYLVGRVYQSNPTLMLVLGGVIISSIFSSILSLLKYVADPYNQLPTIVYWLMGSLASASYESLFIACIPIGIGVLGLVAVRWRINVLSMGDREARALGVNTKLTKGIVIVSATLATTGAVCVSGIIGWIGLIIPHIGRMLVGNDNRLLIPASVSLGACYLVLIDDVSRMLTGSEIPIGILTALVGGPFFVYLLRKTKGGGW